MKKNNPTNILSTERKHVYLQKNGRYIMKKTWIGGMLLGLTALVASCTEEEKEPGVEDLVADAVKKMLVVPESYEPVALELDSAYSPYDDPKFYDMVMDFYDEHIAVEDAKDDIADALRRMGQWSEGEQDRYSRRKLAPVLEDHDSAYADLQEHKMMVEELWEDIRKEMKKRPELIGIRAKCMFRAKDSLGVVSDGRLDLLLDTTLTKVIRVYDVGSEEYKAYHDFVKGKQ